MKVSVIITLKKDVLDPQGKVGTKYKVHLPAEYSDKPGTPVDAVVVDIPFKESFNANTREVVKG